jgi:beta-glucanase (GH16 family)
MKTRYVGLGALVAVGLSLALALSAVHAGDDLPDDVPRAGSPPRVDGAPPGPTGQGDGWELVFSDEFEDGSLDLSRWADHSGAEADHGRGNYDNDQLEWNRADNCLVSGGELTMSARRQEVTSPSGTRYGWTSCLLSSAPSYAFQYGFIEERAVLPAQAGFWPAFWTWQAAGVDRHVETDVYEVYTADRGELHLTQHSAGQGSCQWRPRFDPAADWHTYAAAIEPSGTVWYVDGVEVCRTEATSDAMTNIVSNLAVHAKEPPAAQTTAAVKRVDYVRAWHRR